MREISPAEFDAMRKSLKRALSSANAARYAIGADHSNVVKENIQMAIGYMKEVFHRLDTMPTAAVGEEQ